MGCVDSRLSTVEQAIAARSLCTGFELHRATALLATIRRNSYCDLVLPGHFQVIKDTLRLNSSPVDAVMLNNFYDRLSKASREELANASAACPRLAPALEIKVSAFRAHELTAAAILLSEESDPSVKADALFSLYDVASVGSLSEQTVEDMFRMLLRLAVNDFPLLLPPELLQDDIRKYLAKCKENEQQACEEIKQLVLKTATAVSVDGFLAQLVSYKNGALTTAAGLRQYAHDQMPALTKQPDAL